MTFTYTTGNTELFSDNRPQNILRETFNNIPGNTWQQKLDHCNQCNCCTRHSINRPTSFKPWIETNFSNTPPHLKENMCKCNCRHNARFICRQCDDIIDSS